MPQPLLAQGSGQMQQHEVVLVELPGQCRNDIAQLGALQCLIVLAVHHDPCRRLQGRQFNCRLSEYRQQVAIHVNHELDGFGVFAHAVQHQRRG